MSFAIQDASQDCQNELNIIDQRVTPTDFLLFFNRANKYFMSSYKMPTTQRVQDYLLFNTVREYPLPADFVGMMNMERPYELDQQNFMHSTEANFMRWMQENWSAIKFDKELKLLMMNYLTGDKMVIHNLSDLTTNGTWVAGGDASNLVIDGQYYTAGNGSMRVTVTGATGSMTLTGTGISKFDLTQYINNGFEFLDVYNSNPSPIWNIQLRIGSDASNYYQTTATTRYNGQSMDYSFGQVGFDLTAKTTVGTPVLTALTYVKITVNFDPTFSGTLRFDNLFVANPTYFKMPYYSLYNVKTNAGVYQEKATAQSDTILCPAEFDQAFTYKVCEMVSALKLKDPSRVNYFMQKGAEAEADLKVNYPCQNKRSQITYYRRWNTF